jgi:GTP-binding protein HflX
LSDTVGFISDLPTTLVAAFRATLEEVVSADLILHVQDISHPERHAQCADVERVLLDLGVAVGGPDAHLQDVWNKIDKLDPVAREEMERASRRNERPPVLVSAVTGEGIDGLLAAIDSRFASGDDILSIAVPATHGALIHWLHENTEVIERNVTEDGSVAFRVNIDRNKRTRLFGQLKRAGLSLPNMES